MPENQNAAIVKTALGWAGVAASEEGICAIILPMHDRKAVERILRGSESGVPPIETFECGLHSEKKISGLSRILDKTAKLLECYFSGKRVVFDLPLDTRYYTDFQRAVWNAAAKIPHGETRSYGWIARRIGKPKAARAVGQALGANPIPVIIP